MIDPHELSAWLLNEVRRAQLEACDEATRLTAQGVVETCLRVGAQFGALTAYDQITIRHRVSMALTEGAGTLI